jgi:hypothetical protein
MDGSSRPDDASRLSQFMEIGNPNLAEKNGPSVIRCLSQRIDKERDSWHFIRLIWQPIDQGIPFENA